MCAGLVPSALRVLSVELEEERRDALVSKEWSNMPADDCTAGFRWRRKGGTHLLARGGPTCRRTSVLPVSARKGEEGG